MHARGLSVVSVVVALWLGACASSAHPSAVRRQAQNASLPGKPACFWLRNVYDWTILNHQELIVHAPMQQDAYLVKLFEPVFDLAFHQNLGFQDVERTGQICNDSNDYLIVRGNVPQRVPIVAVRRLTGAQQASLLQASGKHVANRQSNRH